MSILRTDDVTMHFGGVVAVEDLNLHVDLGEIVAVIGPNGAGKTTAFNMMTGVYTPTSGDILFDRDGGKDMKVITGKRTDLISAMGIARTFQNIRLFSEMTVLENVMIAKHNQLKSGFFGAITGWPRYYKEEKKIRESSMQLLERVGLADECNEISTSLPYGKQRRLEIARALATNPRLLLLDEPAAGMNPTETKQLTDFVSKVREDFDLSILLIEHHMQIVMDISDRIYVLDFGKTIACGTSDEIQNNDDVIKAYLGVTEDD